MRRIICVLVVLATPALLTAGGDDVRNALKALQGTWKAVGMEAAGKAFPKDAVLDFAIVIGADGKSTGKTPAEEFTFKITVDPAKKPRTIDNLHETGKQQGKRQYGIYKVDGDRFTVCITPPGGAEADRPKEFDTKDSTNVIFVFERVKEAKKP